MCIEVEKKKYGFFLGGIVNFVGRRYFFDVFIDEVILIKEIFDYKFFIYFKICCFCVGIVFNVNLFGF